MTSINLIYGKEKPSYLAASTSKWVGVKAWMPRPESLIPLPRNLHLQEAMRKTFCGVFLCALCFISNALIYHSASNKVWVDLQSLTRSLFHSTAPSHYFCHCRLNLLWNQETQKPSRHSGQMPEDPNACESLSELLGWLSGGGADIFHKSGVKMGRGVCLLGKQRPRTLLFSMKYIKLIAVAVFPLYDFLFQVAPNKAQKLIQSSLPCFNPLFNAHGKNSSEVTPCLDPLPSYKDSSSQIHRRIILDTNKEL